MMLYVLDLMLYMMLMCKATLFNTALSTKVANLHVNEEGKGEMDAI